MEVTPQNPNEFINNTPSFAFERTCWQKRPCYRLHSCEYCQNRQIKFFLDQLHYWAPRWSLTQHVVIAYTKTLDLAEPALAKLSVIRSTVHQKILRKKKYLSFISVGESVTELGELKYTPHFHILTEKGIEKSRIRKFLTRPEMDFFEKFGLDIFIETIRQTTLDYTRLGRYLMCQNYFKSLEYRPYRVQLQRASRGFVCGKPRHLPHIHGKGGHYVR